MIDTFSSKDENSSKSSEPLPLALELKDIKFTLLPFDRFGIGFEEISLGIESIEIDSEGFNIGRISQIAKSSIGGIYLIGSFKGGVVEVDKLNISSLDIGAILETINANKKDSKSEESSKEKSGESNSTSLVKLVKLKEFSLSTASLSQKDIKISSIKTLGEGLSLNLENKSLSITKLGAKIDSNLVKLRLNLSMSDKRVSIKNILIDELDIDKIMATVSSLKGKDKESKQI